MKSSRVSRNIDSLEGGFDALMQVLACDDIIGWREDARHLLIYVSDGTFHHEGDGLVGIFLI